MIRSMTGFGAGTASNGQGEFFVELRSLNNRFLDLSVKLPRELSFLELDLRDEVKQRVRRGKVELFVRWIAAPGAPPLYEINQTMLRHYVQQVRQAMAVDATCSSPLDPGSVLSLPGVVNPTRSTGSQEELARIALAAVQKALDAFDKAREVEGVALVEAIQSHLDAIEAACESILQEKDHLMDEYIARLREKAEKLRRDTDIVVDDSRLETEIMLFADKCDITEELVRLRCHLRAFRQHCQRGGAAAVGKTLDFIVQELLREVNTIGNKARGLSVANLTVMMKGEIEKIREQVQNLE
jgi:uncharacterized protein (TIGR00255 family)